MLSDVGMPGGLKTKFITAVTGFEYPGDEEKKLGIRSFTMRHAFNSARRASAARIIRSPAESSASAIKLAATRRHHH
jgi:hypothetical protein